MESSLRRPVGDGSRFQVPVYKAECTCKEYVILWQVDVAFDERADHNTQVVKGISIPEKIIGKAVFNISVFFSMVNLPSCTGMSILFPTSPTNTAAC